jgi:hypothetical protein
MEKFLISMPDNLATRMRASIPVRQRSKTIVRLIDEEVKKRERLLYECAIAVEKDASLNQEMKEWDVTLSDGVKNGSW